VRGARRSRCPNERPRRRGGYDPSNCLATPSPLAQISYCRAGVRTAAGRKPSSPGLKPKDGLSPCVQRVHRARPLSALRPSPSRAVRLDEARQVAHVELQIPDDVLDDVADRSHAHGLACVQHGHTLATSHGDNSDLSGRRAGLESGCIFAETMLCSTF
jgi:hypothetical protein